eukprot:TRINITY_DN6899_c0_g1_i2.p1 TRINITY_DN6899_c0_g1~~TRINITY_DN6899_c0_g1_i2.p1  ORF type:complete len:765 (+),score=176.77 TRINITY_DN6899_c0_g1_i2:91-2385(+)
MSNDVPQPWSASERTLSQVYQQALYAKSAANQAPLEAQRHAYARIAAIARSHQAAGREYLNAYQPLLTDAITQWQQSLPSVEATPSSQLQHKPTLADFGSYLQTDSAATAQPSLQQRASNSQALFQLPDAKRQSSMPSRGTTPRPSSTNPGTAAANSSKQRRPSSTSNHSSDAPGTMATASMDTLADEGTPSLACGQAPTAVEHQDTLETIADSHETTRRPSVHAPQPAPDPAKTPQSTLPLPPAPTSNTELVDKLAELQAENDDLRKGNQDLQLAMASLTETLTMSKAELEKRANTITTLKEEIERLRKTARRASLGSERPTINSYARPGTGRHASFTDPRYNAQQRNGHHGEEDDDEPAAKRHAGFQTAADKLALDEAEKRRNGGGNGGSKGPAKRAGLSRKNGRGVGSSFAAPFKGSEDRQGGQAQRRPVKGRGEDKGDKGDKEDSFLDSLDPHLVEKIENEIMTRNPQTKWDDIAGLAHVKKLIREIIIWPLQRPDIFKGLRKMAKGILLFGPPGTGKTLIGKAIASEVNSTFFSISSSSLTSKWVGEGEKLVRALFAVARENLPAIIFIDEIDSLLTQRSEGETEGSRRIKTEFLVQLDGATTNEDEMLLILGATNRPQELDEAARRRLVRRLYVPLPDELGRRALLERSLLKVRNDMSEEDVTRIVQQTAGYSGADLTEVCKEAALGPLRNFQGAIIDVKEQDLPPVGLNDFLDACHTVQSSVAPQEIVNYEKWNDVFGTRSTNRAREQVKPAADLAA